MNFRMDISLAARGEWPERASATKLHLSETYRRTVVNSRMKARRCSWRTSQGSQDLVMAKVGAFSLVVSEYYERSTFPSSTQNRIVL